jgi:ubiquinone/menaquinone biosynthesis C-methylase UbiE
VTIASQSGPDSVSGSAHEPPAMPGSRRVSAAQGYERWASTYDEGPNPLLAREERHLLPLLTDLRNKSVLDLACGTGRWLEKLVMQGCGLGMGIDRSSAMLRVARKKRAIRGRLAKADCENLPLANAGVDLVICSFAWGHIQDMGSAVRELARVTRHGADIFVSDLHPEAYAGGWRVGFRDSSTAVEIDMWSRTKEQIVHAFCESGFESKSQITLWLGEPEKTLFTRAGKTDSFVEACRVPAILVCHFRRIRSVEPRGRE